MLSWDTEGGDRVRSNLLRSPGLGLRVWVDNQWVDGTEFPATVQPSANGTRYLLQLGERNTLEWNVSSSRDSFEMTLSAAAAGQGRNRVSVQLEGHPHHGAARRVA